MLLGQPTTDFHPGGVHTTPGNRGVRPGQVDVLEHAALGIGVGEAGTAQPVGVDGQQLARLHLADEAGADDVQRRGLAGHHPAALEPAQHQRAHPVRVARRIQGVLVAEHQRECPPQPGQHALGRVFDPDVRGGCSE